MIVFLDPLSKIQRLHQSIGNVNALRFAANSEQHSEAGALLFIGGKAHRQIELDFRVSYQQAANEDLRMTFAHE